MKKTLAGFFGVLSLIAVFLIPSVSHAGWIGTPSTVTVTADPPSVTSGGSTVISWAVSQIKPAQSPHNPSLGCTKSGAWSGFIADTDGGYSGSYNTGSLTSNKTYSISCLVPGGGGTYNTITNSVTVGVDAALPPPEPTAEDGNCGYYDKQVSSSHPSTGMWDPRYADYGYSAVCDNGSYSNSYTGHTDTGDYWNWRCNGSNGGAPVFCSAYKSTTMFDLSVYTVSGVGTSTASGINCGTDCTQSYSPNTTVTLRGTSAAGYQTVDKGLGDFFGVSCASGGWIYDCTFIMTGDKTVGVRFRPITYTLTTSVTGGVGTITGIGINCSSSGGSACSETINSGTTVTLTATGGSGYAFSSWSGACSGNLTTSCTVTMDAAKSASASFTVVTPFDYSLSNSGALSVTKGSSNVFTQNTITKTLVAGATESVTITATGMPTGVSVGYDANRTSNPTGNSTITFTITPTATVGTHSITVTGSPLNRTTSFNLTISGSPITVTCTANPSPVLIGQSVTWTASVSGGVSPLTYVWSGTNLSPAPTTNPFTKVYTTIGQKTATVTVTDSDGTEGTCVPAGSVQVNFDPTFEEF